MTQPVDPSQENSLPPIPLPPQATAYGPGPQPQPGPSVSPAPFPGQPNPQQPYPGYPGQQPYQAAPQQYAIPAKPAGPGILELDFWLPKTKLLALLALSVPAAVTLLSFIFGSIGAFRYFTVGTFFSFLFNLVEALVIGLVMMFSVLGIGRILGNKNKTE